MMEKRERKRLEREMTLRDVLGSSRPLADGLFGYQGKYELRGKRRDDIIREF